jgi:deoxyribonuclease V
MKLAPESTPDELAELQEKLSSRIIYADAPWMDRTKVAGIDVAYSDNRAVVCAVVLDSKDLRIITTEHIISDIQSPYVPGLLALREASPMINVLKRMRLQCPVLVDGNGVLHPRRFGLACSVGLELGAVTIGVAKTLMFGHVGERTGDTAPVVDREETMGVALWLGRSKKPVYVSVGNNIGLETAVWIVRQCSVQSRPEPIRMAHTAASVLVNQLEHNSCG